MHCQGLVNINVIMIKGITWILAIIPSNIFYTAATHTRYYWPVPRLSVLDVSPLGIFVNAYCLQKGHKFTVLQTLPEAARDSNTSGVKCTLVPKQVTLFQLNNNQLIASITTLKGSSNQSRRDWVFLFFL